MGKHVDDMEFVRAFLQADNINQVAVRFNMSHAAAYTKATNLRAIGVQLPRLQRSPVDVGALNEEIGKPEYRQKEHDRAIYRLGYKAGQQAGYRLTDKHRINYHPLDALVPSMIEEEMVGV